MENEEVIVAEIVPESQPEKKKPSRFTRKTISAMEFKTIKNYSEGMKSGKKVSMKKCAELAGYKPSYAAAAGHRIKELMTQNDVVREMMERKGLGIETLVNDLDELRKATRSPTELDPEGKHPDNMVRQRNAEFRAQLLDALPPKKMEIDERHISINISADTIEKIKELKGASFFENQE